MAHWIDRLIEAFRRRRKELRERRENFWPISEIEIREFADKSYSHCVDLVGPPGDEWLPFTIRRTNEWPSCRALLRSYVISLSETSSVLWLKFTIGHEIYHRVTIGRSRVGAHRLYWVHEMMAQMAGLVVLHRELSSSTAYHYKSRYVNDPAALPLSVLKNCWPSPFVSRFGPRRHPYPEGFYSGVTRVGIALRSAVGIKRLCTIVSAHTLKGWVSDLPPHLRYSAAELLELKSHGYKRPESFGLLCRHAGCLLSLDRFDDAWSLLRELHHMRPESCRVLRLLSFLAIREAMYRSAIDYLLESLRIRPDNYRGMSNLVSAYGYLDDDQSSLKWINRIVELWPNFEWGHYYRGILLQRMGRDEDAVEAWERVVDLDDDYYALYAEKLIAKCREERAILATSED